LELQHDWFSKYLLPLNYFFPGFKNKFVSAYKSFISPFSLQMFSTNLNVLTSFTIGIILDITAIICMVVSSGKMISFHWMTGCPFVQGYSLIQSSHILEKRDVPNSFLPQISSDARWWPFLNGF
jgi:hypothetical protein